MNLSPLSPAVPAVSRAIPLSLRASHANLVGAGGAPVYELMGFVHRPPPAERRQLPMLGALARMPFFPETEGFRLTHDRGRP